MDRKRRSQAHHHGSLKMGTVLSDIVVPIVASDGTKGTATFPPVLILSAPPPPPSESAK